MPRRRNTPGGPAAFAAYTNGPGAAPPPPPRPSKAKAAAAYASRFVKSPDNWWLLLLLASAALYAQLLDAALAPKALEGFAVTGDAKFYRDVVARHAKARVLVDGLGPLSSPVWRTHDDANDLLFAEASAQRVWRHEDGTGLVRVGASVFLDATGPLACVATAEADALVLCGDQSTVTVADDGTRETLWAGAATAISRGATHVGGERNGTFVVEFRNGTAVAALAANDKALQELAQQLNIDHGELRDEIREYHIEVMSKLDALDESIGQKLNAVLSAVGGGAAASRRGGG